METRQRIILKELMVNKGILSSNYLATKARVTSRTIRNDIKQLNEVLRDSSAMIEARPGKGYELIVWDEERFQEAYQSFEHKQWEQDSLMPDIPRDRVHYLLKRLILAKNYLTLSELAEELHISRSTVQGDLKDVKAILQRYGLKIETRPNHGLRIIGEEIKKRFCLAEYMFERTDLLSSKLPDIFTLYIGQKTAETILSVIIEELLEERQFSLADTTITNLYIHIVIAYIRVINHFTVTLDKEDLRKMYTEKEFNIASSMIKKIENSLHLHFPEDETAYIALHLNSIKLLEDTDRVSTIDENIARLVERILDAIEEHLHLHIKNDPKLFYGLCYHLKPVLNRFKYEMNMRNPLLEDIKKHYPISFEAAVLAGLIIIEETGIAINEDEIGYLSLHIEAALKQKQINLKPKNCLIVCASGEVSARIIKYKLKNHFAWKLNIIGTSEYFKLPERSFDDIDFIVSSIPISDTLPVPVVHVNTILTDNDIMKIEAEAYSNTTNEYSYWNEKLCFFNKSLKSKEDVFKFLTIKARELGFVSANFLDMLRKREDVASTAYGNFVAIPHPISPVTEKSFLSVCTLREPIPWGEEEVQLIFLLSIKKGSTEDLQSIYQLLGKIIESPIKVQRILKAKNYMEFLKVLMEK